MLGEALNYLGSALDKPGRAVRGVLSGNLREGLAAVPFSDSMGITDEHQRVSGRDLANNWGLTRSGDKGWGSWGVGAGIDMATDPLNYLPGLSAFKMLRHGDAAAHGLTAGRAATSGDLFSASMRPNPINVQAHNLSSAANNASRTRRFSTDPAKAQYYAGDRADRFSRRFGFGGAKTPKPTTPGEMFNASMSHIKPADYASMARDEATPLGRLHGLANSAGVDVYPGVNSSWPLRSMGQMSPSMMTKDVGEMLGGASPLAVWHGGRGMIVPNVIDHPGLWSDTKAMQRLMDKSHNQSWLSTGMQDHLAVHEIGHGLHMKPGNDMSAWHSAGLNFGDTDANAEIKRLVSQYGNTNALEYIAERFAQESHHKLKGWPRGNNQLTTLYDSMGGPTPPEALISKLKEYGNASYGHSNTHAGLGGVHLPGPDSDGLLRGGLQDSGHAAGGLDTSLRGLRSGTPVFKNFGNGETRVVGGNDWGADQLRAAFNEHQGLRQEFPGLGGASVPPWWEGHTPAAGTAASFDPAATREEILHAMTARAAASGNIGQLPALARPAAHAYRLANSTGSRSLRGIGSVLDELSAKAMAERTTKGKLGAAMNFLLDPQAHRLYDGQFAAHGLLPRAAYHTLPYAIPAGAAGAAGYALSGDR